MKYYTQRQGMRNDQEKTYIIDPRRYKMLLNCCKQYYINLAWKYPEECSDGAGCCGFDEKRFTDEIYFEIPELFFDSNGSIESPDIVKGMFGEDEVLDEYNQFALLDLIEFFAANVRDVEKVGYHSFFNHYHYITHETTGIRKSFIEDINECFKKTSLLYQMNSDGQIERLSEYDVVTEGTIKRALSVNDTGTRDLLQEAIALHRQYGKNKARDSVEKLWDAFERMKSYYGDKSKKESAEEIVSDMSEGSEIYKKLFNEEFKYLTNIGNDFRIRHHERNRIEIDNDNYYDYFFNRCLSLMVIAIRYLH